MIKKVVAELEKSKEWRLFKIALNLKKTLEARENELLTLQKELKRTPPESPRRDQLTGSGQLIFKAERAVKEARASYHEAAEAARIAEETRPGLFDPHYLNFF